MTVCCSICDDVLSISALKSEAIRAAENLVKCNICYGLMDMVDGIVQQCMDDLSSCGFQFDMVGCNINLPASIVLRCELLEHLRPSNGRTANAGELVVQECKSRLMNRLNKACQEAGWSFGNDTRSNRNKVSLEIMVENPDAEADGLTLIDTTSNNNNGHGRKRKRNNKKENEFITMNQITDVVNRLKKNEDKSLFVRPTPQSDNRVTVKVTREPIMISGNYVKYSRRISQSKWVIDGTRKGESSVEEMIGDVFQKHFQCESYKFHGAGREDMDVRMLGEGRPFVLELINSKLIVTNELLERCSKEINDEPSELVGVNNIAHGGKQSMERIIQGENSKKKQYTCVVWVSHSIKPKDLAVLNEVKDMEIIQKTPVRVLHRRSAMDRSKMIHSCECEYINSHFFILRLVASAGTYIKEFVHGDMGRTSPSVASLMQCEADILQLDVEKIII